MTHRVIIIGAGIGGLSTAAVLSRRGIDVTVLEAHTYPGGSAGTFFHQGYHFDAGATLAGGFYPGGPMEMLARSAGIEAWPLMPDPGVDITPCMTVHLPDGSSVDRWSNDRRWEVRRNVFGHQSVDFWEWQERTADDLWDLALRLPEWPFNSVRQAGRLAAAGFDWLRNSPSRIRPGILLDAFRPVSVHLAGQSQNLRDFVDGQLLISAQAVSEHVYSLYGASALDLPRRGIGHVRGGIGAVAETLAEAVRQNGGRVLFRKEVARIQTDPEAQAYIETKRGERFFGDTIIANLPLENINALLHPQSRSAEIPTPEQGWGAFIIYAGIKSELIKARPTLHHQVLTRRPFGEGNSLFISISHPDDHSRAPEGFTAITISTHTDLRPWWHLFTNDRNAYEARKEAYFRKILSNAERAIPELSSKVSFVLSGTPVTFHRFTRRSWGWVGGIPQTSLWEAPHPKIAPNIWMVGDSIFPGQSIPAVALGGIRVAGDVLRKIFSHEAQKSITSLPLKSKSIHLTGDR